MDNSIRERIVNSSSWAAYGDALGFVTELANRSMVEKRTGKTVVNSLCPWKRRIGGISGAIIDLPEGIYSDDTQLRLSTSRCINASGYFDVEMFAKIELPVWLSYCLGAGRGTKAAASNLTKSDVNWFSNFYKDGNTSYVNSGGNGAVMRIQPHIWGGIDLPNEPLLLDVIKNSICTHGHARAIVGACFHALMLKSTIDEGRLPLIPSWVGILTELSSLSRIVSSDMQLSAFWLPVWESLSEQSFEAAVSEVIDEMSDAVTVVLNIYDEEKESKQKYIDAIQALSAFDPAYRGSGTLTAILGAFLACLYQDYPEEGMIVAANALGSDTDSIATVGGALMGAITIKRPAKRVLDQEYIDVEACRLWRLNSGLSSVEFNYPDLASWKPPRRLADSLLMVDGCPIVTGLGKVTEATGRPITGKNKSLLWSWVNTTFGQTLLIRRREKLTVYTGTLPLPSYSAEKDLAAPNTSNGKGTVQPEFKFEVESHGDTNAIMGVVKQTEVKLDTLDIDELSASAISSKFDQALIGQHLLDLIDGTGSIENVIAYAAIVAKARKARNKSKRRKV